MLLPWTRHSVAAIASREILVVHAHVAGENGSCRVPVFAWGKRGGWLETGKGERFGRTDVISRYSEERELELGVVIGGHGLSLDVAFTTPLYNP